MMVMELMELALNQIKLASMKLFRQTTLLIHLLLVQGPLDHLVMIKHIQLKYLLSMREPTSMDLEEASLEVQRPPHQLLFQLQLLNL